MWAPHHSEPHNRCCRHLKPPTQTRSPLESWESCEKRRELWEVARELHDCIVQYCFRAIHSLHPSAGPNGKFLFHRHPTDAPERSICGDESRLHLGKKRFFGGMSLWPGSVIRIPWPAPITEPHRYGCFCGPSKSLHQESRMAFLEPEMWWMDFNGFLGPCELGFFLPFYSFSKNIPKEIRFSQWWLRWSAWARLSKL